MPGLQSNAIRGLSAARLNLDPASTSPFDQLDPLRTQSISGLSPRDPSSRSQNTDDLASVVRQITNLNRHVTTLESKLVTRIEVCESDVSTASNQALELVAQYNEVSIILSNPSQQLHKLTSEWDECNGEETRSQDHEGQEEIVHDPAEQSTMIVPTEDPVIERSGLQDRVFRSLIDLTPIQHQRDPDSSSNREWGCGNTSKKLC